MIRVNRLPKPKILVQNEEKWMLNIRSAKKKKDLDDAIGRYHNKSIKDQLFKMFQGKCAYCESKIEHIDFGDIEHYKPKSKFPLHAVQWENLLLSCARCNVAKGDVWPNRRNGGPLINPCDDDPEDFFEFVFDRQTSATIVRGLNARGRKSEEVYDLNRISLIKQRNEFVKKLVVLAAHYNDDHEARNLLDEATQGKQEYAAFARMIRRTFV